MNPNNMEGDSYTYDPDAFDFKYHFLAVNFTSTEFAIMFVSPPTMKVIAYGVDPNFASQWITTDGTYVTITNPTSWLIRVTMF